MFFNTESHVKSFCKKKYTIREDNDQVILQKPDSLEGAYGSRDFAPREPFDLTKAMKGSKN